ncbi:methyltransferase [Arthrobacter sp. H20]|uniref:class I SAM-dependent methyltransferase n=1 Tax=Arthrobacter sp. H20 TaxID=1267981 RepID=UPI00047868A7|nr:methyltransferase [Arthrobacter sp. H20]
MDSHYFSAQPAGPETRKPLRAPLAGVERTLVTSSGIFSSDSIDKGTRILLAEAPDPVGARMLDIGCGWGPLALTMALKAPDAQVVAIDVNERALALTAENANLLGLPNVVAQRPEEVDADATFDTIWSNPPIRVGKDELHALLLKWLPRLSPGGSAWLVVQKNLGADSLQKWIADQLSVGFEVSRTATSKSFRILRVERRDT